MEAPETAAEAGQDGLVARTEKAMEMAMETAMTTLAQQLKMNRRHEAARHCQQ